METSLMTLEIHKPESPLPDSFEPPKIPIVVSPVFLLILLTALTSAWLSYQNWGGIRFWLFLFVISSWIISLSLHEFGHALAAFLGGDKSVAGKGYLTLNPLKYTNLVMSIVVPVLFLMMGGIGFPGGAVYVNLAAIRKRKHRSLVSAAGPLATAVFALVLLLPFMLGLEQDATASQRTFWAGLALLVFLQITALFLNLLPIPGLDGFGIIEPYLPAKMMIKLRNVAGLFILVMFFLLFNDTPVRDMFWLAIRFMVEIINLDLGLVREGFQLFQFWE